MSLKFTANINNPPHIYADDTLYFLTATTLYHACLLASPEHKMYFQEQLFEVAYNYKIELKAWVVLDNHYHALFYLPTGDNLSGFVKSLHTRTAITFNQLDNHPGRQVWWNYWDWCIRGKEDYWRHFNYTRYNPVKHGYVQQLRDWPYSSLLNYMQTKGRDWLDDCWRSYPIREFQVDHDKF